MGPLEMGNSYSQSLDTYDTRMCIEKFPDWSPGAKTANGTALCY